MEGEEAVGKLLKVDCESLNSLVQEYDQSLEDNFKKRSQFEKFREDYEKLKARLKTLPEKLEYDAMVPICSKALCPGKIIHTNEILVLLGENTFVECSSKKAIQIVGHRLKNIDETLNKLNKERDLYIAWKREAERQMVETLGEGTIEIMEDYDEKKEEEWRAKHRQSVRNYHEQLAKERKESEAQNREREDKQKLWHRLDALELEEEFMEAQAIYEERLIEEKMSPNSNSVTKEGRCAVKIRERADLSLKEEIEEVQAEETSNYNSSGKKVTFSPENIVHNLVDLTAKKREFEQKELYKPSETSESGSNDPIFIRFRHEAVADLVSSSDSDDSEDSIEYQVVLSPGDIYEQFGPPALQGMAVVPGSDKTPLKSILKPRAHSEPHDTRKTEPSKSVRTKKPLCETPSVMAKKVAERIMASGTEDMYNIVPRQAVVPSDTQEFLSSSPEQLSDSSRPVSLFKKMKSGQRALSTDGTN